MSVHTEALQVIACPHCHLGLFEKTNHHMAPIPDDFIEVVKGRCYDFSGEPWQVKCPRCKSVITMRFVPKEGEAG
jgi:phage FluMu protein Com